MRAPACVLFAFICMGGTTSNLVACPPQNALREDNAGACTVSSMLRARGGNIQWYYSVSLATVLSRGTKLSRRRRVPVLKLQSNSCRTSRRFHWCNVVPETMCAQAPTVLLEITQNCPCVVSRSQQNNSRSRFVSFPSLSVQNQSSQRGWSCASRVGGAASREAARNMVVRGER